MGIKKAQFKVKNGGDWDKYCFETSADQVKVLNEDGTESDMQSEISAALRMKSVSENGNNLTTGCLQSGIYPYKANTAGRPPGLLQGIMFTINPQGFEAGYIYKIVINVVGGKYLLVQDGTTGSVIHDWKEI